MMIKLHKYKLRLDSNQRPWPYEGHILTICTTEPHSILNKKPDNVLLIYKKDL